MRGRSRSNIDPRIPMFPRRRERRGQQEDWYSVGDCAVGTSGDVPGYVRRFFIYILERMIDRIDKGNDSAAAV